jgi:hypothetical protein
MLEVGLVLLPFFTSDERPVTYWAFTVAIQTIDFDFVNGNVLPQISAVSPDNVAYTAMFDVQLAFVHDSPAFRG